MEKTPSNRVPARSEGYSANLSIRCLPAVLTHFWFF